MVINLPRQWDASSKQRRLLVGYVGDDAADDAADGVADGKYFFRDGFQHLYKELRAGIPHFQFVMTVCWCRNGAFQVFQAEQHPPSGLFRFRTAHNDGCFRCVFFPKLISLFCMSQAHVVACHKYYSCATGVFPLFVPGHHRFHSHDCLK